MSEIRNGRDLFHETDDRFTYWYANAYGIQPSFDNRAYKNMSVEDAREIADELTEIAQFCEELEIDVPDLHS